MTVWISLRKSTCMIGVAVVYALGCYSGCYFSKDKEYSINKEGDKATLKSKYLGKEYPLWKINNELYLGSSMHNFKGAMEIAKLEGVENGKSSMDIKIKQIEDENKALKAEAVRNKIVNTVENVEDKVKDKWEEIKKELEETKHQGS